MNSYMVEVTLAAVTDGQWSELRRMTDVVPGTFLIEDAEQPVLVLPVEAESHRNAPLVVQGVVLVAGLNSLSGTVSPTPPTDFDRPADDGDGEPNATAAEFEPDWLHASA